MLFCWRALGHYGSDGEISNEVEQLSDWRRSDIRSYERAHLVTSRNA